MNKVRSFKKLNVTLASLFLMDIFAMKTLIAHRGMSALAPENTLASFRLCKEYGITWLECDVDILEDHTVVVSHDDTLDRCTDQSGSLYDLKSTALSEIDAGSWFSDDFIGERIPTITQLISLANKLKLDIVAEGIEEEFQLDFIKRQGVHRAQGYLFAKPMCHSDMSKMLKH